MFNISKKIIFVGILILSFPCFAQSFDVSLWDFDDTNQQSVVLMPKKAQAANQQIPTPTPISSPEISPPSPPNLGRNEEPKKDLTVLFNPLPEVKIPLQGEPEEKPLISKEPDNKRFEKIIFPGLMGLDIPISDTKPSALSGLHNVTDFDIAGFYLGITPQSAILIAKERGYKITRTKRALSIFQTTYYDDLCRNKGLYQPKQIRDCIRLEANKEGNAYISEMVLQKKSTRESFHIYFSSDTTGNEAYSIIYQNKGDNSLNFTRKNVAKKLARRDAFLRAIVDTFGNPDDPTNFIWGSTATAFMHVAMTGTAYDATITLFDRELYSEDFEAANDWNNEHPIPHHFDFAE